MLLANKGIVITVSVPLEVRNVFVVWLQQTGQFSHFAKGDYDFLPEMVSQFARQYVFRCKSQWLKPPAASLTTRQLWFCVATSDMQLLEKMVSRNDVSLEIVLFNTFAKYGIQQKIFNVEDFSCFCLISLTHSDEVATFLVALKSSINFFWCIFFIKYRI